MDATVPVLVCVRCPELQKKLVVVDSILYVHCGLNRSDRY